MSSKIGVDRQGILQAIFASIDEINETLPDNRKLEKSAETRLFGRQGGLESLEFVNFIVLLEQRIGDEFGLAVTLADEKAIDRKSTRLNSSHTVISYAVF